MNGQLRVWLLGASCAAFMISPGLALGQLNEHCIVSVLNRTVQVKPDGTWVLPNIPANFGPVRARATCVENGVTRSGQSDFFTIPANGSIDVPAIMLGPVTPIPTQITISANPTTLTQAGQTVQLQVAGRYTDGNGSTLTADIAGVTTGTTYLVSNPNLATVSQNGLVTARASGTVLVQAQNEGAQGILQLTVALSGDSDGDGILDDIELREGLNPNNPADAFDDLDRDGLVNRDELQRGTNLRNPDTDSDGLFDGEEVVAGVDGFVTNPLLTDTDADGVPDNVEVASGSDPTNAASVNLAQALSRITASPASFVINVNSVEGQGFQQLRVTGEFRLGGSIDLTSLARGTNYSSSDLQVCNFGAEDGRVFGGVDGTCTITVTNSGFTATANVTVRNFTPRALSSLPIPGYANNVDAADSYAYVAAGGTGLQVVSVSDPLNPQVVGSADTPGNANDVRIVGNLAFVADGSFGLRILDVQDPAGPTFVGAMDTPGEAVDVTVFGNYAYIADTAAGLAIINVANPANPSLAKQVDTPGIARGVDILQGSNGTRYAVVVDDSPSTALRIIDVSDPANATLVTGLGLAGSPKDVRISGNFAYVAAFTGGFQIIDLANPLSPVAAGSLPSQFVPRDVEVTGNFALFAEQLFPNAVPIVEISNSSSPLLRTTIDFSPLGDYAGTGIALSGPYLYMTGESFVVTQENGVAGNTRLFIGQFLPQEDRNGIPPEVTLTLPVPGSSVIRGSGISLRANAADDVAVAAVTFSVNGVDVFTDTSAPYEALFTVPENATTLTVLAKAIDLGSNLSISNAIEVTAIPDPLTTVTGRVVRSLNGTSVNVADAGVTCLTMSTASAADGRFMVTGLPTIRGNIQCSASAQIEGKTWRGNSISAPPVLAGVTALGDIQIREGSRVLILSDIDSNGVTNLAEVLAAAGNQVTLRPAPEYTWDGTNPPLADFGCIVHLDGSTYSFGQPAGTQQALVDFVRSGGGYITQQWKGYERETGVTTQMNDLILISWPGPLNCGGCTITYNTVSEQAQHPLLAGIPETFTFFADGHSDDILYLFGQNESIALMRTNSGGPAVAVRQFGTGRTVMFSHAANYFSTGTLADPNIQKLFVNAVQWACTR